MPPIQVEIKSINFFDKYQGAYAILNFAELFTIKLWAPEDNKIFLVDFPFQNNSSIETDGYGSYIFDFIDLMNSHFFKSNLIIMIFEGMKKIRIPE